MNGYLQTLIQAEIINEFEKELLIHRAKKAN